jgi:CDP-4-dehydro-6-deoxyglucose reductase
LHHKLDRELVLYWGVRSLRDLYLPHLPGQWQSQHRNFTYIPVLSDPLPEDAWPGRTGFVHAAVATDFPDLSGYQVYACGGPLMIDAARAEFTQKHGLPAEEFYSDSFTYAAEAEARTS